MKFWPIPNTTDQGLYSFQLIQQFLDISTGN